LRVRSVEVEIGIKRRQAQRDVAILRPENFDVQNAWSQRRQAQTVASAGGGFDFNEAIKRTVVGTNAGTERRIFWLGRRAAETEQ
jgi:hypothetical protein